MSRPLLLSLLLPLSLLCLLCGCTTTQSPAPSLTATERLTELEDRTAEREQLLLKNLRQIHAKLQALTAVKSAKQSALLAGNPVPEGEVIVPAGFANGEAWRVHLETEAANYEEALELLRSTRRRIAKRKRQIAIENPPGGYANRYRL